MRYRYAVLVAVAGGASAVQAQVPTSGTGAFEAVLACQAAARVTKAVPYAFLAANDACIDLTSLIQPIGDHLFVLSVAGIKVGGSTVNLQATFDAFLTFGATTTNPIAGPVTYAFLFGTPIIPQNYGAASSTGGVTVTPGVARNTTVSPNAALYPTYISGYGTLGAVPTNLNVDNGNTNCTATTQNNTCNFGLVPGGVPGFYDNLEALLTYTQDDLGSVASWSGRINMLAATVPEPSTVTLMASGVLALGATLLRRKRES